MLSASEARANQLETEARAHAREMASACSLQLLGLSLLVGQAKLNSKLANLEEDMVKARADMDELTGVSAAPTAKYCLYF